jgi:hypothetical protein
VDSFEPVFGQVADAVGRLACHLRDCSAQPYETRSQSRLDWRRICSRVRNRLGVVAVYVAATNGPDRQSSSGMYALGDGLLFAAVFAVAAIPATCVALFFLRRCPSFWLVLSIVASGVALSAVGALIVYVAARNTDTHSALYAWSGLAVLRILATPLFSLAFLLAGVFAPSRFARFVVLIAAGIEGAVSCCILLTWIR